MWQHFSFAICDLSEVSPDIRESLALLLALVRAARAGSSRSNHEAIGFVALPSKGRQTAEAVAGFYSRRTRSPGGYACLIGPVRKMPAAYSGVGVSRVFMQSVSVRLQLRRKRVVIAALLGRRTRPAGGGWNLRTRWAKSLIGWVRQRAGIGFRSRGRPKNRLRPLRRPRERCSYACLGIPSSGVGSSWHNSCYMRLGRGSPTPGLVA